MPDLNGNDIVSVPLHTEEEMKIGYITNSKAVLSNMSKNILHI